MREGDEPGWDDDRVYEVADALLHGEEAPEPDPDELPATGARLKWLPAQGPSATPAQGLERADLMVDGERVGSVDVGWEVDPYAIPLLQTAHRTGARVVLRHVAGTEDLSASVGATHPPGTPLLKLVRELRADRGPVLLITALHRDFASTDTLAALAIADVGVALDDPRAATPWTADIITGTDLAAAVRILSAIPVARSASESAVHLAQGGTTLAGLLLVTGEEGRSTNPVSFRRWLNPVNAAPAHRVGVGNLVGQQGAPAARSHAATADRLACAGPRDRLFAAGRRRATAGRRARQPDLATPSRRPVLRTAWWRRCAARLNAWGGWRRRPGTNSPIR